MPKRRHRRPLQPRRARRVHEHRKRRATQEEREREAADEHGPLGQVKRHGVPLSLDPQDPEREGHVRVIRAPRSGLTPFSQLRGRMPIDWAYCRVTLW